MVLDEPLELDDEPLLHRGRVPVVAGAAPVLGLDGRELVVVLEEELEPLEGDVDLQVRAELALELRGLAAWAGKGCEIPNFGGSYLDRFPLVSANFWTSDHLWERSRRVDAFAGTRARGTLMLKRP